MITNAKKETDDSQEVLSTVVLFLTVDGKQVREEPILINNMYVSEKDHDKYGKVETYVKGEVIRHEYFLKQFRGGRDGELLVNPYGMFAKAEDLSAYVTQRGHRFCEYVKVPDNIYFCYMSYLQSRDSRYFRSCEKYILDQVKG